MSRIETKRTWVAVDTDQADAFIRSKKRLGVPPEPQRAVDVHPPGRRLEKLENPLDQDGDVLRAFGRHPFDDRDRQIPRSLR